MSEEKQAEGMALPGPEHERLKAFAGKFRAVVKIWMGPGDPFESTGTMTNRMDFGGRFLRQDYKGDPGDGPFPSFEGAGFFGFNTTSGKYEDFWIDNASTIMQTETGEVDAAGKVWTMVGDMPNPQTGEMMTKRSVITLQSADEHMMEMFFVQGGNEFRAMEIRYKRA